MDVSNRPAMNCPDCAGEMMLTVVRGCSGRMQMYWFCPRQETQGLDLQRWMEMMRRDEPEKA